MEIVGWALPPGQPLRVWTPATSVDAESIAALAQSLAQGAMRRGIRWITDPTETTPAYLLRLRGERWELIGPGGLAAFPGTDAGAAAALARVPARSSLYVQLPAPSALVEETAVEGVASTEEPEEADYILAGRFEHRRLSYAWVRPLVRKSDRAAAGLPLRSKWTAEPEDLREAVTTLRRIRAWHELESPPQTRFPYRLGIRHAGDRRLAKASLAGGERYELVLRATSEPLPAGTRKRYVYAFLIDGAGKGILLFPRPNSGSVENRLPVGPFEPEIALGPASAFVVTAPFGPDTWFLLSADEPLPDPSILEWAGVRSGASRPRNALEQLLLLTASGTRSTNVVTRANWSIERVVYESVELGAHKTR